MSARQRDARQGQVPRRPGTGASGTGPPVGLRFVGLLPFLLYREVRAVETSCSVTDLTVLEAKCWTSGLRGIKKRVIAQLLSPYGDFTSFVTSLSNAQRTEAQRGLRGPSFFWLPFLPLERSAFCSGDSSLARHSSECVLQTRGWMGLNASSLVLHLLDV